LPARTGTGGFTVNKKHDSADSDKFYFVSFVITRRIDLIDDFLKGIDTLCLSFFDNHSALSLMVKKIQY